MGSGAKRLLQRWLLARPLPYLKQGSTISIRSKLKTDLRIRSHWRDDGELSFLQHCHLPSGSATIDNDNQSARIFLSRNEDKMTSLGREDPHLSIDILEKIEVEDSVSNGHIGSEPIVTSLSLPPPTTIETSEEEVGNLLTIDVPDKINIDCNLTEGGSIFVENKIEGDVRLKTAQGNISVKKLRGHHIELDTTSIQSQGQKGEEGNSTITPSTIFVSDVLESQSLRLAVDRSSVDRIRAKRIHANTMEIQAGGVGEKDEGDVPNLTTFRESLLDEDDSGAICDIGSLYLVGDATVNVQQSAASDNRNHGQRQAVRIKSHHGHVHVQVSAPKPNIDNELTGEARPMVDLGGVNGSCEVFVSRSDSDSKSADDEWTSCHVHFDSIAPDSVSLIDAKGGNVHVTVDRKVESDVRLFSSPSDAHVDTEILLLEDNEDGSLADEVTHMIQEIEDNATSVNSKALPKADKGDFDIETNRIKIETQAFTSRDRDESGQLQHCQLVDGWVENTTSEPDSRFDRKIRGNSGGGKINLGGAQNQALHGFVSDRSGAAEAAGEDFARPLLAVSSTGKIVLETLSWLGNIARRYGLDENRSEDDLGRQATRRKGLGRVVPKED
ncbi:unnamed protein product [Pseudo-nitzschia multistriata]|uniref:Adhesin domain-containing protein n=1 Tax=Pseudo-nitzschia multistriata TaxID=183589 RepID=A0A448ZDA9_9STRA|nr:unnamed protein product [Pseudo-nitzschia multistriata]